MNLKPAIPLAAVALFMAIPSDLSADEATYKFEKNLSLAANPRAKLLLDGMPIEGESNHAFPGDHLNLAVSANPGFGPNASYKWEINGPAPMFSRILVGPDFGSAIPLTKGEYLQNFFSGYLPAPGTYSILCTVTDEGEKTPAKATFYVDLPSNSMSVDKMGETGLFFVKNGTQRLGLHGVALPNPDEKTGITWKGKVAMPTRKPPVFGTWFYLQCVNSTIQKLVNSHVSTGMDDTYYVNEFAKSFGVTALDNTAPYGFFSQDYTYLDQTDAPTSDFEKISGDEPSIKVPSAADSLEIKKLVTGGDFTTYQFFHSNQLNSVPVPLRSFTWGTHAEISKNGANSAWLDPKVGNPPVVPVVLDESYTESAVNYVFPSWTCSIVNGGTSRGPVKLSLPPVTILPENAGALEVEVSLPEGVPHVHDNSVNSVTVRFTKYSTSSLKIYPDTGTSTKGEIVLSEGQMVAPQKIRIEPQNRVGKNTNDSYMLTVEADGYQSTRYLIIIEDKDGGV